MTPVLTEVPLGGEDQLWPKCSPAGRARLFAGRRERHREEPVIMRTANSGVTGEQPHMMQSRLFPALLTCCLYLPTLVSAKRRKEVRQLMPKLFCLVCANTVDSKEAWAMRAGEEKAWPSSTEQPQQPAAWALSRPVVRGQSGPAPHPGLWPGSGTPRHAQAHPPCPKAASAPQGQTGFPGLGPEPPQFQGATLQV